MAAVAGGRLGPALVKEAVGRGRSKPRVGHGRLCVCVLCVCVLCVCVVCVCVVCVCVVLCCVCECCVRVVHVRCVCDAVSLALAM